MPGLPLHVALKPQVLVHDRRDAGQNWPLLGKSPLTITVFSRVKRKLQQPEQVTDSRKKCSDKLCSVSNHVFAFNSFNSIFNSTCPELFQIVFNTLTHSG